MEKYLAIHIASTDEIVMAHLAQLDFESFEELDTSTIAYVPLSRWDESFSISAIQIMHDFGVSYEVKELEPQNWNALWEASFQPVIVNTFCQVRADFHPPQTNIKHELVINPKMAFGTGHHATTHMMIEQMASIDFGGKKVFDFGCGTGILAILASKLGASEVDALDIEHESYLNTIENAQINEVENVKAYEGEISKMGKTKFGIILANINRNILQKYAVDLASKLHPDGIILLSGILEEDIITIVQSYAENGLHVSSSITKDGWGCVKFIKAK